MSHLNERIDKTCLNCGVTVLGRYCQQCGQENVEVKESFFHLFTHFIEDLTHFDGKFFKTLRLLLFKPASLTKLYMEGKRATYLHPIRMYLFISAIFFLIIFSGKQETPAVSIPLNSTSESHFTIGGDSVKYKSVAAYDTAQSKLTLHKRDKWIKAKFIKQTIYLEQKYKGNAGGLGAALMEQFQHYFSRMLYISLPIFAFFLWVLYRRNKAFYFVDHVIFSIHIYCAFFIFMFLFETVNLLTQSLLHKTYDMVNLAVFCILEFYLYKSLRNHFNQSRSKTIFKFLLLNLFTSILMAVLMAIFILLSLFNI